MSLLARIRIRQARLGRPSLVLIAFAWLNVILQPCAMAMTGSLCPHCPPAHAREHAAHESAAEHGHAMAATAHEHGGGDVTGHRDETHSGSTGCGGDLSDCANLDNLNQSERIKPFSPDFKLVAVFRPPAQGPIVDMRRTSMPNAPPDSARLAGAYPPLNVLYCVYLD